MTVRVEREVEVDCPPEAVWAFISDPASRAGAISVVDSFEVDGDRASWQIALPIPLLSRTVEVQTRDVERDPPRYVKFVGRSSVMQVTGEHTVEGADGRTRLRNTFVVEGRVPGVERFFERHLDEELGNLERALRNWVAEYEETAGADEVDDAAESDEAAETD
ncbi:MAG: SRPBCC family protein [Halobacteriaceae archaeon]